jgi:dienelactone hydrolase
MKKIFSALCLSLTCLTTVIAAPDIPVDDSLGESIVFVKGGGFLSVSYEVTVFKPKGVTGKLPIVIVNHGKQSGPGHFQARNRPIPAVRSFLARGYAVIAPMRGGFSNSSGAVIGEGCDIESNGEAQAKEIRPIVDWLGTQDWADASRIAMFGQSHGGLTTLAYALNPSDSVKVFVNFAGGLKWASGGCDWQRNLVAAYRSYGKKTTVKTLWFYGANDSYFPPEVIQPAYDAYQASGGKGELVAYPAFGNDAHAMFAARTGLDIWLHKTLSYFDAVGLPTTVLYPQYDYKNTTRVLPSATNFAPLDDVSKLPLVRDTGRAGYIKFLTQTKPRAFAIAENGAWGWANGENDNGTPEQRALTSCLNNGKNCKLYAVDDRVVWESK